LKRHLIILAGPTAVGKTALSIQLAKHYQCPIISADSRQFYKEMIIGTAKPSMEEMKGVTHYFINNKSIDEVYNIGEYEKEVILLIDTLFSKHELLILVGGSGLYINAVLNGLDEFEEIPNDIRESLMKQYSENGITFLQEKLKQLDFNYFKEVDTNNPQRMMRALEVCMHTKKPFSEYRTKHKKTRNFQAVPILLNTNRALLYERINKRVDDMIEAGLVEEVKGLHSKKELNALNTVGYKEIFSYLENKITLDEAIQLIKQNSRRYAKRQLTWFTHQGDFETFEPTEIEKIKSYISIITEHS
jgi:tRNA dimethylallyltransferase